MTRSSATGQPGVLSLVLHAHLPFIRCPEHPHHLEERWLFEAVTESYIPLLAVFERLADDRIEFGLTLSMTPPLMAMLQDRLLMDRYAAYLQSSIELCEKEIRRTRTDQRLNPLARLYRQLFGATLRRFEKSYRRDIAGAFGALQRSGSIEILAGAATHAYLPATLAVPAAARAQITVGAVQYRKAFGRSARGIWLPECGYAEDLEPLVREEDMLFFFLESHGVLNAVPQPRTGIYAPLLTPYGLYAFGRDASSSRQVWSATEGYPGDSFYRDFYRDIGFDLDFAYLKPHLPEGVRTFTGLKYYRITGGTDRKLLYLPERARRRAHLHAEHFLRCREEQIASAAEVLKIRPIVCAAYDAELFGHWWFEGPLWLEQLIRKASARKRPKLCLATPSAYIASGGHAEYGRPAMSSWGDQGFGATWVHASNSWIYRHLNRASRLMIAMAGRHNRTRGLMKRALNQAARELLLAQSSDWAFMMKTGNAEQFAGDTVRKHLGNFLRLHGQIVTGRIRREELLRLEARNNIFPDIDFRYYTDKAISSEAGRRGTT